jgi:cellulose synthase/poly-beta-1,6-N-acetylglucosamine synthase-like glycosyltransferase
MFTNLNDLGIAFIERTLLLSALILLLPITVLFIECIAALLPNKKLAQDRVKLGNLAPRPKVAVLIAAHNEEIVIGGTISTIIPQLSDRDQLIVIADNCSDRTATIAGSFNITVLERQNLQQKGKGYALDYGLQSIQHNPYDVVIVLDADCHIEPNYIKSLAQLAMTSGRPVQPVNLLYRVDESNLKSAISELAFIVKNLVRPKGLAQLNLPCMITMGTAYPWSIINQVSLASDNLVEDMQLGIDLAIAGNPALFCLDTKVTGVLPQKERAATTQRTRWEHGHLSTLQTQVPYLLKESWRQKRLDLLSIALDLSIPPLSFLVIIWFVVATIGLSLGIIEGTLNSAIYWTTVEGLLLFVAIFSAWAKFGRKIIPFKSLLRIPGYIFWKAPIYLAFLIRPQQKWIRTERDQINTQVPYNSEPSIKILKESIR